MAIGITNSVSLLSTYYGVSSLFSDASTTFASIDADDDGAVSKEELSDYVTLSVTQGKVSDPEALFDVMDTDGDGSVSEDEYTTYGDSRANQLSVALSAQASLRTAQLSLISSIGTSSSSSSSVTSGSSTASSIIAKYAENVSSTVSSAISSIDVEA